MWRHAALPALRRASPPQLQPLALRRASQLSPAFSRASRAIELKYADGTCTLAVPLPLSGFDEERVFSFPPETTVAEVVRQIEAEDPSVQAVEVRSARGAPFEPRDSLVKVLTDDFELVVNGRVLPVRAPVFSGGTYRSVLDDGDLDVRSVAQKSSVISLRHAIETLGKWKVSYQEFVQMCREHGIPKKQAPEVLAAFHQAGVVFYFGKADDEDLQHSVFLQPRSVLDSYLESLGLTPRSTQLFEQERERLLAKILALEPEHRALVNLQRELDLAAHRQAGVIAYGLSTALVGTFGLYFWLSFIHFSWDIMEPVTYFTGFGVSILGYAWWSITNQEYEYENIYHYVYSRRKRSLATKAAFDKTRYNEVEAELSRARDQLAQTELVLAKATPLQARYLHLLEPKESLTPPVPPQSPARAA